MQGHVTSRPSCLKIFHSKTKKQKNQIDLKNLIIMHYSLFLLFIDVNENKQEHVRRKRNAKMLRLISRMRITVMKVFMDLNCHQFVESSVAYLVIYNFLKFNTFLFTQLIVQAVSQKKKKKKKLYIYCLSWRVLFLIVGPGVQKKKKLLFKQNKLFYFFYLKKNT